MSGIVRAVHQSSSKLGDTPLARLDLFESLPSRRFGCRASTTNSTAKSRSTSLYNGGASSRGGCRALQLYSAPERSTSLQLYSALHSTSSTPSLRVALLLAEILNVVQVFSPAQAVTVCYCCYCCSAVSKQKMPKNPGKIRKYLGFFGYFRVLPALDAGDRRGSLPGLPYCCSAGLTLATVVGEPHCCSVVTVNTSNTCLLYTSDAADE